MAMTDIFLAILAVANCAMRKFDGQVERLWPVEEREQRDSPFPRKRKISAAEGKAAFLSSSRSCSNAGCPKLETRVGHGDLPAIRNCGALAIRRRHEPLPI